MNCSEAHRHLATERDSALEPGTHAGLEAHLAGCAECRRRRSELRAGLEQWRHATAQVQIPDPEREWHAVRRRLRSEGSHPAWATRRVLPWLALPFGAAAAVAVAFYIGQDDLRPASRPAPEPKIAQAPAPVDPSNASTMVFVDDKSGWLVVWAGDTPRQL